MTEEPTKSRSPSQEGINLDIKHSRGRGSTWFEVKRAVRIGPRVLLKRFKNRNERWVTWSVVVLLVGALIIAATVPPPWGSSPVGKLMPWSEQTLGVRLAITGVIVGLIGVFATVLALVHGVEEVRELFPPTQMLNVTQHFEPQENGDLRTYCVFKTPPHNPIVNALRIEIVLRSPEGVIGGEVSGIGAQNQPVIEARWNLLPDVSGSKANWAVQSRTAVFPEVRIDGPVVTLKARHPLSKKSDLLMWTGRWWTDRNGPNIF